MHRRILGLLLSFILVLGAVPVAFAEETSAPEAETQAPVVEAQAPETESPSPATEVPPTQVDLHVDGAPVEGVQVTLQGGVTYVSLSGLAVRLRADAVSAWEGDRLVVRGEGYALSARTGDCYLEANGRYLYVPGKIVVGAAEGDLLVPVRALALALGAQVGWDGSVDLTTGGAPIASGADFYDPQSVDLLARIIYHESGNQPFDGQLAVGNVILNRVRHPSFPDTIYRVVYQPNQFPGATSKTPDDEAVLAAKLCLDGAVVLGNAYYFNGVGKPCWASANKTQVAVIGNHAFYG